MRTPDEWTQYSMGSTALYVEIEERILDITGWSDYDIQCHHMDAPEWLPMGGTRSWRSKDGAPFVAREWEEQELVEKEIEEFLSNS